MTRPTLEPQVIGVLRRAPDAPELSEWELDELQDRHVAYQLQQHEAGQLTRGGPFSDQPDEALRGLNLYTTTLDEARELAAADPAVVAGRLAIDVFTWWTAPRERA